MRGCNRNRYYGALGGMMAIAIIAVAMITQPVSAQLFDSALDQLPAVERAALREGQAVVSNNGGQFIGKVLIDAPTGTAWDVLTDYDNFDQFLPNVESSQLLEVQGDRHIFEQVNFIQIFPISKRIRFSIAATESRPQQIRFDLVSGDVESLEGVWQLDSVAPFSGAAADQVLITHEVTIDPAGGGLTRSVFLSTYGGILQDTLLAIKREVEQRAGR